MTEIWYHAPTTRTFSTLWNYLHDCGVGALRSRKYRTEIMPTGEQIAFVHRWFYLHHEELKVVE